MSVVLQEQVRADSLAVTHRDYNVPVGYQATTLEFVNGTDYQIDIKDNKGRQLHIENHRQYAEMNDRYPATPHALGRFAVKESSRMTTRGILLELSRMEALAKRRKLTQYETKWLEAIRDACRAQVDRNYPGNPVTIVVWYYYDLNKIMGPAPIAHPRSIFLQDLLITMDVGAGDTDVVPSVHPLDLETVSHVDGSILGERFNDEDTTLLAIKVVNNEEYTRSTRYINVAGEVVELTPVRDTSLENGVHIVTRSQSSGPIPDHRCLDLTTADVEFPLHHSVEGCLARGDEKEYSKRKTEERKLEAERQAQRFRTEQDFNKRIQDMVTQQQTRYQEMLRRITEQRTYERQLQATTRAEQHARRRESGDMIRLAVGMLTSVVGLIATLARMK